MSAPRKTDGAEENHRSATEGAEPIDVAPSDAPLRILELEHAGAAYLVLSYPLRRPASFAQLNRAELEVIEAVLEGTPQREIAQKRGVSVRTVANQLARAYRKLGVSTATEVALLVSEAARS